MPAPRSLDSIYRRPKKKPPVAVVLSAPLPLAKPPLRKKGNRFLKYSAVTFSFLAAYVLLAPYLPGWAYTIHGSGPAPTGVTTLANVPPQNAAADNASKYAYFGKNTLTIPEIGVESEILEGVNEETLERGLWRRPNTSTPELGGNTVIAAHRFKYTTGANTFYHLDKLKAGDTLSLTWKGKTYTYQVTSTETTSSTDPSVEAPSKTPVLTLYTCTPLWTSSKRLVVRAVPLPA